MIRKPISGPKARELLKVKEKYVSKGVFNTVLTFIKRGEGAVIENVGGDILLDFAGGIAVLNMGYSRPKVVKVMKEQTEKFFSNIDVIL